MKWLCVHNHERQEIYVASVVNTVKIYGLRIVDPYHYGSTDSTGITSTVIPSYCCFGLPTGEQTTQGRQGSCLEMRAWYAPE